MGAAEWASSRWVQFFLRRVLPPALTFLIVVMVIKNGPFRGRPYEGDSLLYLGSAGQRVVDDEDALDYLAGELVIPADHALVAACLNGNDADDDRTLASDSVIATHERLIRAAELYNDALAEKDWTQALLIAQAETMLWRNLGSRRAMDAWMEGLTPRRAALIREHLDLRREPPAPESLERYVVYSANFALRGRYLVFVDIHRIKPETLERASRQRWGNDTTIAGIEGVEELSFKLCDDLIDRLPIDAPDLPPLPPISQRFIR